MTSQHFYISTLSFSFGISLATVFGFSPYTLIWLLLGAFVLALIWRRSGARKNSFSLYASIALVFFVLGVGRVGLSMQSFGQSPLIAEVGHEVTLTGVVAQEPDVRENSQQLYLETEEDLVLVSLERYHDISYGDEVVVQGKLTKPDSFTTDLGRTFNYPGYLLAKGIEYKVDFAEAVVVGEEKGNFVIAALLKFKLALMQNIESFVAEPAAGLGEGLLLGVKQALGKDLESAFRATGIIHIVVLSGYNVMLVVIFVMYILGYFLPLRPRVIVGLLAITSFAFMVGLSSTVVRACVMAGILLLAEAFGRMYLVLRGLVFAGTVMLILNPLLLIYDIGFQLSFLATLGLILVAPQLERFFTRVPKTFGVRNFLLATIATQLAVSPLLLYQIGQFSVIAVLVNVIVLPIVPVAMLLTFLTGLLAFVSLKLATIVAYPTYFVLQSINELALWFATWPLASFMVPAFPFYLVPISYAVFGYLLYKFYRPEVGLGEGEIGQRLLEPKVPIETPALDDWQIDEEFDPKELTLPKSK